MNSLSNEFYQESILEHFTENIENRVDCWNATCPALAKGPLRQRRFIYIYIYQNYIKSNFQKLSKEKLYKNTKKPYRD